jgi:RNA polymerase sigma-70 factor (ECF subfamily)
MERNRNLFWKLLEPEHPQAEAFCRRLAGSREDGDDLYQDSLIQALEKFAQLREQSSFRPWLYRIVVNNFNNRIRRPWWKKLVSLTVQSDNGASALEIIGENPESTYLARRKVELAFKAVSPSEKALITLFEIDGWSVKELAEIYRCPTGTIKARLSRARRKMRTRLSEGVSEKKLQPIIRVKRATQTANKNIKANVSEVDLCVASKPIVD